MGATDVPQPILTVKDGYTELVAAAREFVERVDRGEVHSVHTYNRFKAALHAVDNARI